MKNILVVGCKMIETGSFGTHDGAFHADEVTAGALLLLFKKIDKKKIYRTRDEKRLCMCDYVCDVGGIYEPRIKRFDHHQVSYKGSLSSAGMILLYLKEEGTISSSLYDWLNQSLVYGVDAVDNGRFSSPFGHACFSQMIAYFNPVEYGATKKEADEAFFKALEFTGDYIEKLIEKFCYIESCRVFVKEAMEKGGEVLYFNKAMPWLESFFSLGGENHPALFLVMPSGEHWKLRGIPPTYERKMEVRKPLPKEWAGRLEEDLAKVSHIEGAVFCHKGRFISVWKTKEDALKALEIALKQKERV